MEEARVESLQNRRNAAHRRHIGSGKHQMPAGRQHAIDLGHHVHRIFEQMFDQLAAAAPCEK